MSAAVLKQRYARRDRAAVVAEILLDLLEQETEAQGLGFEERCAAVTRLCALVVCNYPNLDGTTFIEQLRALIGEQVALVVLERREAAAREIGASEGGES